MDAKADASETAADARAPERDMEAFGDEETNALMAAQHFASHHPRFSPCSVGRCVSTLMMPLILAIVVGTWLPYVYVHADGSWLGAAALVVFHVVRPLCLSLRLKTDRARARTHTPRTAGVFNARLVFSNLVSRCGHGA